MANMNDIQKKLRKTKWGFLAEMLVESDMNSPTSGVVNGRLLVNPRLAALQRTDVLAERVRAEFVAERSGD